MSRENLEELYRRIGSDQRDDLNPVREEITRLVNKEIKTIKKQWEEEGRISYEKTREAQAWIRISEEDPNRFKFYLRQHYPESRSYSEEEFSRFETVKKQELETEEIPDAYLRKIKERLDRYKEKAATLPPMTLEIFREQIYDKSPLKIYPITDPKINPPCYRNEWYNALWRGNEMLSWRQLPLEESMKLYFYKGPFPVLSQYKQGCETIIESIYYEIKGFQKAAMEARDVEAVVGAAVLIGNLNDPKIISFIQKRIEELRKSSKQGDRETFLRVREKLKTVLEKEENK